MQSEESRNKAIKCVDYLLENDYIDDYLAYSIKNKIEAKKKQDEKLARDEEVYEELIRKHILEDKTETILHIMNGFLLEYYIKNKIAYSTILIFTNRNLYILGETLETKLLHNEKLNTHKIIKKEQLESIHFYKNNKYISFETKEGATVISRQSLTFDDWQMLLNFNIKRW